MSDIRTVLSVLDATLGVLVIHVDDAGATVQVNDGPWSPVAQAGRVRIAPGSFVVRARTRATTLVQSGLVSAGVVCEVRFGESGPSAPEPSPSLPPPASIRPPDNEDEDYDASHDQAGAAEAAPAKSWLTLTPRRWIAVGAAGAGTVSLGTGAFGRHRARRGTARPGQ